MAKRRSAFKGYIGDPPRGVRRLLDLVGLVIVIILLKEGHFLPDSWTHVIDALIARVGNI